MSARNVYERSNWRWRRLLTDSVEDSRQLLREVLREPLRFIADGDTHLFRAPVTTGQLIMGAVAKRREGQAFVASPRGITIHDKPIGGSWRSDRAA